MSKAAYIGVGSVAHKIKKMYIGVNGVARKVKKGYIGVNGVARLFYTADMFKYTGDYTAAKLTIDGTLYDLYTLTSSGILTLGEDAQYWMCGGGHDGSSGSVGGFDADGNQTKDFDEIAYIQASSGFGGCGGYAKDGNIIAGEWAVVVGSANGASSITAIDGETLVNTKAVSSGLGGTGGGVEGRLKITYPNGAITRTEGITRGDGIAKYPFGIDTLKAHCAGGGGGALAHIYSDTQVYFVTGGTGGSNGANGGECGALTLDTPVFDTVSYDGGTGGVYGGGKGGYTRLTRYGNGAGENATFYGSGGGGSGMLQRGVNDVSYSPVDGGSGYQGVCYILMRADAPANPVLAITKQPESVAVAEGEKVVVSFEAVGEGLTYEWWYANKDWVNFSKTSSFTTNTYSLTMDATRDGRRLYCVVTDVYGNSVQTDTVTISMTS